MPLPSFSQWLEQRPPEVPDAGQLALLIAHSGMAGVSRETLLRTLLISPETLEILLRGLLTTGQVTVVKVGGVPVYRATM
jgi:hypothetical protein